MAKIFITGISSNLMTRFVSGLIDHECIGLTRKLRNIKGVRIIVGDIQKPEGWHHELYECDILVHAAGLTHSFATDEYYKINYEATKTIVDLALKAHVKKIVYISSRTACPNSGGYGLSKLKAEEYIKANCNNYLIIKPAEIFGGLKNEGIDKIIENAKHKRFMACPVVKNAPLVPIHVSDVVSLLQKTVLNGSFGSIIFNGPDEYSVQDIIKEVNLASKNSTAIIPIPKWIMFLARNIFSFTGINIGFVPDQVDRLYCKKEIQEIDFPFTTLKQFLNDT